MTDDSTKIPDKGAETPDWGMRAFRARWEAVAAVEAEERRVATPALRWQQMQALFRLAQRLGLSLRDLEDPQEGAVWLRWARLKEAWDATRSD